MKHGMTVTCSHAASAIKDKAINWRALEVPLASQIKGLALLQEDGGKVPRHLSAHCGPLLPSPSRALLASSGCKALYKVAMAKTEALAPRCVYVECF